MSRSMRVDPRSVQGDDEPKAPPPRSMRAVRGSVEGEEVLPTGRIPKNKRGTMTTAKFRAGRGGRGAPKVKRYRGKDIRANCTLRRR